MSSAKIREASDKRGPKKKELEELRKNKCPRPSCAT